jgi:hypothetical protein
MVNIRPVVSYFTGNPQRLRLTDVLKKEELDHVIKGSTI